MRNNSGLIFIITSFLIFNLAATLLAGNPADANAVVARSVIFPLSTDHHGFPDHIPIVRQVCYIRSGSKLLLLNSGVSLIDM